MENVCIVKGERQVEINAWENVSLILRPVSEKQVKKTVSFREFLTNVFIVLVWGIFLFFITWLFFIAKDDRRGLTMFQDCVLNSWGGEWFAFVFAFGLFMTVGQIIWVELVVKELTKLFLHVVDSRHCVESSDGTYYKIVKPCENDQFGKYSNCPLLKGSSKLRFIPCRTLLDKIEESLEY